MHRVSLGSALDRDVVAKRTAAYASGCPWEVNSQIDQAAPRRIREIGKTTQLFLLYLGIKAILAYMPLALKSALRFVIAEEEAKRLGDSWTSTAISL